MMLDKLEGVFNSVQDLDMKPIPHNVRIMNDFYRTMREIYAELEEARDARENRAETDPGRRDAD